MTASDVKKLKELDDGNRQLKHIYVDLNLQHEALKDVFEKNSEVI